MTLWFTEAPELYRPKRLLQRRPPAAKGRRKRRAKGQAELPELARHGLAGLRTRHSGFLARPATACSIPLPLRTTVAGWWPAWFACRSRQTTLYLAAHPIVVAAAGVPMPWRPSSSGLGRRPFTAKTGVRVPLGAPAISMIYIIDRLPWPNFGKFLGSKRRWKCAVYGGPTGTLASGQGPLLRGRKRSQSLPFQSASPDDGFCFAVVREYDSVAA